MDKATEFVLEVNGNMGAAAESMASLKISGPDCNDAKLADMASNMDEAGDVESLYVSTLLRSPDWMPGDGDGAVGAGSAVDKQGGADGADGAPVPPPLANELLPAYLVEAAKEVSEREAEEEAERNDLAQSATFAAGDVDVGGDGGQVVGWYWQEDRAKLKLHDSSTIKEPDWVRYGAKHSADLEANYRAWKTSQGRANYNIHIDARVGGGMEARYVVNFVQQKQINKISNTMRGILRDAPELEGPAPGSTAFTTHDVTPSATRTVAPLATPTTAAATPVDDYYFVSPEAQTSQQSSSSSSKPVAEDGAAAGTMPVLTLGATGHADHTTTSQSDPTAAVTLDNASHTATSETDGSCCCTSRTLATYHVRCTVLYRGLLSCSTRVSTVWFAARRAAHWRALCKHQRAAMFRGPRCIFMFANLIWG